MGSRKHLSRKDISASAFTPKPKPNILQTRPFSSGKHARSSELPKTDILQTRGFSSPTQKSSGAEAQPLTPEAQEKAEVFGYKAASIPAFAPTTPQPTIQRDEVTEEDTSSQSEAETEEYQPIWGFARELSKPQSEEVSPQSGTIQLKCDEFGAEKEEEKHTETIQAKAEISDPIIQRQVEKRVGTSRGVGTAGIGTLTCASIGNLKMAVFWELLSTTGDPFSVVDVTYTFSRGHQPVRYSSAIVPPSTHFERREEFQFNEPGTVAVLLRGATPASTLFLQRVIGPIEANCELRQYPSGGSGPARSPGRPPENSDHDISYTEKKHTRDGSEVRRDLKRGREAHIFNDNIDLSALEQKVWVKGFYAGEFRRYHRWVYISPTQIGLRIQNGRDNVPLYVVEIKGEYRGDRLVYHLDPRTRASEDKREDT